MNKFEEACAVYIGRSAYVWGGQGEDICRMTVKGKYDPEGWIRSQETSTANANRAIATYRARLAEGCNPVWAVDCSGYVCMVLEALEVIKKGADYNTKGLYAKCDSHPTREELREGDLVFHTRTGKAEGIHHVGFYMGDNRVSECRGRDDGCVVTDFDDHPADWNDSWNMFGRIDKLKPFLEPIPEPTYPPEPLSLAVCKPVLTGDGYRLMQAALNWLGYTDADGNPLTEDGKWGKKSLSAWDKAVFLNMGAMTADVTLHIDGMPDITLTVQED